MCSRFQQDHPRVELRIDDGETIDHLERLAGGRLDLVLAESWDASPLDVPAGIRLTPVVTEPAWVALPANHRLRDAEYVSLDDLGEETWALCARESDGHRALTGVARRHGIELDARHFLADHSTQLALVRAGLAVACLPLPEYPQDVDGIVFRRLDPAMARDIVLLTSNRTPSREAAALADRIVEAYEGEQLPH